MEAPTLGDRSPRDHDRGQNLEQDTDAKRGDMAEVERGPRTLRNGTDGLRVHRSHPTLPYSLAVPA